MELPSVIHQCDTGDFVSRTLVVWNDIQQKGKHHEHKQSIYKYVWLQFVSPKQRGLIGGWTWNHWRPYDWGIQTWGGAVALTPRPDGVSRVSQVADLSFNPSKKNKGTGSQRVPFNNWLMDVKIPPQIWQYIAICHVLTHSHIEFTKTWSTKRWMDNDWY